MTPVLALNEYQGQTFKAEAWGHFGLEALKSLIEPLQYVWSTSQISVIITIMVQHIIQFHKLKEEKGE